MNLSSVASSLDLISRELDDVRNRREIILKGSRDVISLSSKSIVAMHTDRKTSARALLKDAKKKLVRLRKEARQDLTKYLISPETEYVEAEVLLSIITKRRIPAFRSLSVSEASYILGLLDVIGEIKRLILDSIRMGKSDEASDLFSIAEGLYIMISPFASFDKIAGGTRRKLDVARALVENSRAVVTDDRRRHDLLTAMQNLSSRLSSNQS